MHAGKIHNLDELMGGALTRQFNAEMERVLKNVFDPNTDPKTKRKIQITITIVPNERRDVAEFKVEIKSTIAPHIPMMQSVFLSMDDEGTVTATELTDQEAGQIAMNGDETTPRVVSFTRNPKGANASEE